jgi:hypothetical protein
MNSRYSFAGEYNIKPNGGGLSLKPKPQLLFSFLTGSPRCLSFIIKFLRIHYEAPLLHINLPGTVGLLFLTRSLSHRACVLAGPSEMENSAEIISPAMQVSGNENSPSSSKYVN